MQTQDEANESAGYPLRPEELEAIKEGLNQLDDGQGIPHEEFIKKLKTELNIIFDK
jgi:hypothetical protein